MIKKSIVLNSVSDVKSFVNIVNEYPFEIDLISGRYVVDGKSIMGIFSLDLKQPITCCISAESTDERAARLLERLSGYIEDRS